MFHKNLDQKITIASCLFMDSNCEESHGRESQSHFHLLLLVCIYRIERSLVSTLVRTTGQGVDISKVLFLFFIIFIFGEQRFGPFGGHLGCTK